VLVSDRWAAVCTLVRRHGVGIVVSPAQLHDLGPQLAAADYPTLRSNVYRAREALSLQRQLPRLTGLYRALLAGDVPADRLEAVS
jgi:hypothetical protein